MNSGFFSLLVMGCLPCVISGGACFATAIYSCLQGWAVCYNPRLSLWRVIEHSFVLTAAAEFLLFLPFISLEVQEVASIFYFPGASIIVGMQSQFAGYVIGHSFGSYI